MIFYETFTFKHPVTGNSVSIQSVTYAWMSLMKKTQQAAVQCRHYGPFYSLFWEFQIKILKAKLRKLVSLKTFCGLNKFKFVFHFQLFLTILHPHHKLAFSFTILSILRLNPFQDDINWNIVWNIHWSSCSAFCLKQHFPANLCTAAPQAGGDLENLQFSEV